MSKKMMLLALAVAALFALPSAASAQEIHFSGVTTFTGAGGAGSLSATNEPKISCTKTEATGGFNTGSSTTGIVTLDFSGCTAEFLGIKGNCNTSGAASGTIADKGTFHLITFVNSKSEKKPAILVTPETATLICAGFSRIDVTGNGIIGTITSPKCGESSTTMTVVFEAEGSTQKHLEYTGVKYDLQAHTENAAGEISSTATAGLAGTVTLNSATSGTLDCT
jgi:hypothetical protein